MRKALIKPHTEATRAFANAWLVLAKTLGIANGRMEELRTIKGHDRLLHTQYDTSTVEQTANMAELRTLVAEMAPELHAAIHLAPTLVPPTLRENIRPDIGDSKANLVDFWQDIQRTMKRIDFLVAVSGTDMGHQEQVIHERIAKLNETLSKEFGIGGEQVRKRG